MERLNAVAGRHEAAGRIGTKGLTLNGSLRCFPRLAAPCEYEMPTADSRSIRPDFTDSFCVCTTKPRTREWRTPIEIRGLSSFPGRRADSPPQASITMQWRRMSKDHQMEALALAFAVQAGEKRGDIESEPKILSNICLCPWSGSHSPVSHDWTKAVAIPIFPAR